MLRNDINYSILQEESFPAILDGRPNVILEDIHDTLHKVYETCSRYCPSLFKKISAGMSAIGAEVVAKPLIRSVSAFTHVKNIVSHVLMWPGNIVLSLAHAVAPIDYEGNLNLPLVSSFPTIAHPFLLISDICTEQNVFNRIRNAVTGILAISAGIYFSLLTTSTLTRYLEGETHITFDLNECIETLQHNHLSPIQIALVISMGYVAAFNAIVGTTNLFLHGIQDFLNGFLINLKIRHHERVLLEIDAKYKEKRILSEEDASDIQEMENSISTHSKTMHKKKLLFCLDVSATSADYLLQLPLEILKLPTRLAQHFPLVQANLLKNNLYHLNKRKGYKNFFCYEENIEGGSVIDTTPIKKPVNLYAEKIFNFLNLSNIPKKLNLFSIYYKPDTPYVTLEAILFKIQQEYLQQPFSLFFATVKGYWTGSSEPAEIILLTDALKQNYFDTVKAHLNGELLPLPLLPSSLDHFSGYFDKGRYQEFNKKIDDLMLIMLQGKFLDEQGNPLTASFYNKLILANSCMYYSIINEEPTPRTHEREEKTQLDPQVFTSFKSTRSRRSLIPSLPPTPPQQPRELSDEESPPKTNTVTNELLMRRDFLTKLVNQTPTPKSTKRPLSPTIKAPRQSSDSVSEIDAVIGARADIMEESSEESNHEEHKIRSTVTLSRSSHTIFNSSSSSASRSSTSSASQSSYSPSSRCSTSSTSSSAVRQSSAPPNPSQQPTAGQTNAMTRTRSRTS